MSLFRRTVLVSAVIATAFASRPAGAISFTGDVPVDFSTPDAQVFTDPIGDVGMPNNAPAFTISGWDYQNVAFVLDSGSDMLHVGIDFFGIGGDVDGDGIDGNSAAWLLGNGGIDYANMNFGESVVVAFDFDQNGSYDLLAGINGFNSTYAVTTFNGIPSLPYAFGFAVPAHDGGWFWNPLTAGDFELSLAQFSLLDAPINDELCFNATVFAGSINDDGVGEDFDSFEVCFSTRTGSTEDLPAGFTLGNYPNPFNPTTTLAFTLPESQLTELAVFDLSGRKVATLVDGLMAAGSHSVVFDASGLASGLYIYTLRSGQIVQSGRMVLAK
jgi:hypothetical protein